MHNKLTMALAALEPSWREDQRDAILQCVAQIAEHVLRSPIGREPFQEMIARLGLAAGLSRIYISVNHRDHPSGPLHTSQCYEWTQSDMVANLHHLGQQLHFDSDRFPRWVNLFKQGKPVYGLVRDFPKSEQAVLAAQQIRSLAVIPIMVNQEWWGLIGFEDGLQDRYWTPKELDTLRMAADIIGAVIQRRQIDAALRAGEERYRLLVETIQDVVYHTDVLGRWTFLNPAWYQLTGYTVAESLQTCALDYIYFDDRPGSLAVLQPMPNQPMLQSRLEMRCVTRDGETRWVEANAQPIFDAQEQPTGMIGVLRDVSARKAYEARIERLAYTDPLTGLANRRHFYERGQQAVANLQGGLGSLALLYLDLDKFKRVNDRLGHDNGDRLLSLIGERLRGCVRSRDVPARIGGDEFVVLLAPADATHAQRVAERISARLNDPFRLGGETVRINSSIGLVVQSDPDITFETLVIQADQAMYHAKRTGHAIQVYDADFARALDAQGGGVVALRNALQHGQLQIYYQPIYTIASNQTTWREAFLYWGHDSGKLLKAMDYLALAADDKLLLELDRWMLHTVLLQAAALPADQLISLNLHGRSLHTSWFLSELTALLTAAEIAPQRVVVEVTENQLITDWDYVRRSCADLQQLGVRLALDNFGSPGSSLDALQQLPFDILKLSPSRIAEIGQQPRAEALLHSLIHLGTTLGMEVVAEGINTPAQLAWVTQAGVCYAQGDLLAPPTALTA